MNAMGGCCRGTACGAPTSFPFSRYFTPRRSPDPSSPTGAANRIGRAAGTRAATTASATATRAARPRALSEMPGPLSRRPRRSTATFTSGPNTVSRCAASTTGPAPSRFPLPPAPAVHLERTEEITLARQAALSAVPAPTGAEGRRAARVAELFREVGLQDVLIDEVGNVRGWTAGAGGSGKRDGAGPVVLAAHLDTVFGPDVNVAVERRGRRLRGPGISDNARGLAALVAVAEAVVAARVPAARPILFAAPVGEEGSGDLRGVKYLLNGKDVGAPHAVPLQQPPIAFIALDGAGLERVVHRALGSKRYHVTYRGPGGHSWAAFGVANPANAVGRAVA